MLKPALALLTGSLGPGPCGPGLVLEQVSRGDAPKPQLRVPHQAGPLHADRAPGQEPRRGPPAFRATGTLLQEHSRGCAGERRPCPRLLIPLAWGQPARPLFPGGWEVGGGVCSFRVWDLLRA